jgi:hypothetical protein
VDVDVVNEGGWFVVCAFPHFFAVPQLIFRHDVPMKSSSSCLFGNDSL